MLRTLVESLPALQGDVSWGYGCEIGVYAQHVYASLPDNLTILEYLEGCRGGDTTYQTVLDIAGCFLFQGDLVHKQIRVLSGGERARLCLAGLLLAPHNVLVLDEPGNHLDVETVEALADAVNKYEGTVLLTSHDRHFVHRVANSVIEVRDGTVTLYPASYDAYLDRVEHEMDEEGTDGGQITRSAPAAEKKQQRKQKGKQSRSTRKEVAALERKIAQLDEQKSTINQQQLSTTDAAEAQRLHEELTSLQSEIASIEQRWFELQDEFEAC
jgi:ATP-binding cassette subfamily F protein 3